MLLAVTFIFSIIAPASFGGAWTAPSPGTWLYVEDYVFGPTAADLTGTQFNVTVNVFNVTNLGSFEFKLGYNTTILDAVKCHLTPISEGYFRYHYPINLTTGEWDAYTSINDTLGRVYFGCAVKNLVTGWTGNGSLLTTTFEITMAPPRELGFPPEYRYLNCTLDLYETETVGVKDLATFPIEHEADDGFYNYIREQIKPGAPVAKFTWTPAIAYECDTVTLDASESTDGGFPPITYKWTVTGNATLTGADNTVTTTMHCDGAGVAVVTLNVTNDIGYSHEVTHEIEQRARVGCILDLYTSENRFCGQTTPYVGKGPNEPCDALSPDVNITLFAEVTWNGKPVMHVLVAFEVLENTTGTPKCVLYRTAETDKDGIAKTWFRVPTPCEEQLFGKWIAIVSAKIQEVEQKDTMPFDVGYLITLVEVWTIGPDGESKDTFIAPCDMIGIGIAAKNIAWIKKSVKFVVVVYDDCDVPIGQVVFGVSVAAGKYCDPADIYVYIANAIHVPQWTYVGRGKVYASAFTALPSECGVPYCPEVSCDIALEWSG